MSSTQSNSPDFSETINLIIDRHMTDVHTCMPGLVVDYDATTQTATIQPALKRFIAGQVLSLPQLLKVPVIFPATATAWVRLPVAAGDRVLLHFAEGSLDTWWVTGGEASPDIPTKFALVDAIAVLGLNPQPNAIVPKGAPTSLEVVNGAGWLEITSAGQFKITNGTADLIKTLDSLVGNLMQALTIPAVVGVPLTLDPATIVQLGLNQTALKTLEAP